MKRTDWLLCLAKNCDCFKESPNCQTWIERCRHECVCPLIDVSTDQNACMTEIQYRNLVIRVFHLPSPKALYSEKDLILEKKQIFEKGQNSENSLLRGWNLSILKPIKNKSALGYLLYKHQWNTKWAFPRKLHILHVKITCYLHTWRDHRGYGYITFEIWYFDLVFHRCLYDKQNITYSLMDMNFIFSCSTLYLTRSLCSLVRYRVDHSKIKFISTRGHVISSMYLATLHDDVNFLCSTNALKRDLILGNKEKIWKGYLFEDPFFPCS